MSDKEVYLGDGLYASYDGWHIWLRTPRDNGDHVVALEPRVLAEFMAYADKIRKAQRREASPG